jgi:penicillin-binding protein 1A
MTGGSLPAMTFKLLMDYAHQGIELRPIPGIENPLPQEIDPEVAAAEAKKEEAAAENNLPEFIRPRMLSVASSKLLREIGEKLKTVKPLKKLEKVADAG